MSSTLFQDSTCEGDEIESNVATFQSSEIDNDDGEELTAAQVVERIKIWWLNEKLSPCLLEPQTEVVNCLLDQLADMDTNLQKLRANAAYRRDVTVFKSDIRVPIHRMEMCRIRYMIASYLRIRLAKIEKFIHEFDFSADSTTDGSTSYKGVKAATLLSPNELVYAKNYKENIESHLKVLGLKHMPGDFGKLPKPSAIHAYRPTSTSIDLTELSETKMPQQLLSDSSTSDGQSGLDSTNGGMVFVQVAKAINNLYLPDVAMRDRDQEIDMSPGSQHLLDFSHVHRHINEGSLQLI